MWSSVPGGRDALDLLCITFSAYQVLHDSSLLFCAEVSGTGLRLAERVLSWVEDLKGAVKAEDHVSRERCLFCDGCHECHNVHTSMSLVLLPEYFAGHRTAITSVILKSIDMKSSWMVCVLLHYHLPVLLLKTQETHDRNAGHTCTSAANYCAERGKNGRVRSPQAG